MGQIESSLSILLSFFSMKYYLVVAFVLLVGTAVPAVAHYLEHGVVNATELGLAFFLWLNVMVSVWEICLFLRIDLIEQQHRQFLEQYKGRELQRVVDLFGKEVNLGECFSTATWAEIWSTYSIFDQSYADRRSFGFFIDIGNGFSTLLPTLACIYGMTYHVLSARLLGLMLLLVNYQMWYGTLIYFTSYICNRRFRGHSVFNVFLFVGISNGLWFTFPLWGIRAAYHMIMVDDYSFFLSSSF